MSARLVSGCRWVFLLGSIIMLVGYLKDHFIEPVKAFASYDPRQKIGIGYGKAKSCLTFSPKNIFVFDHSENIYSFSGSLNDACKFMWIERATHSADRYTWRTSVYDRSRDTGLIGWRLGEEMILRQWIGQNTDGSLANQFMGGGLPMIYDLISDGKSPWGKIVNKIRNSGDIGAQLPFGRLFRYFNCPLGMPSMHLGTFPKTSCGPPQSKGESRYGDSAECDDKIMMALNRVYDVPQDDPNYREKVIAGGMFVIGLIGLLIGVIRMEWRIRQFDPRKPRDNGVRN